MRSFALIALMLGISGFCLVAGAGKTITVTEGDKGRTITLTSGDQMDVRLAVQSGTGYSWELLQKGDQRLTVTSETNAKENALPGAAAEQVFHIVAKSAGTVSLVFHYARPWEKNKAPAKIFRCKLRIRQ